MIDTECPLCGHKGKVPDKFSGRQVKCPECCNVFNIGGAGATSGSKPGNEKIGATAGSKAGNEKINTTSGSKAGTEKLSPTSGSKAGNEKIKVNGTASEKKVVRSNADTHHGTMKVVKPGASNQGAPKVVKPGGSNQGNTKKIPAKVAKSSGFGALTLDEPADSGGGRRRRRRGPSIMPLLFSLFLLVGCLIGGIVIYDQMFGGSEATSEQAANSPTTEETKTETKQEKKEDLPPPDVWIDVTNGPFRHGNVSIRVTGAAIMPVKLKGQEPKADARHFILKLDIENQGEERVDYQGWGTAEPINDAIPPVMKDNSGKAYKRLTFGAGAQVDGMILAESIQPAKKVSDVVVFEVPGEASPYVRIELSAGNFNKAGKVRLEIPKSLYGSGLLVKKDPDPKKIDPKKDPPGEESVAVTLLRKQLKIAKTAKDQVGWITALGEQGAAAHTAAADLVVFVKTKNEVIQVEAITALAKIGPLAAKESVPVLRDALKDPSFKVRTEAAKALGKMGPDAKDAIPALMEAIKDNDADLVESAKQAIKQITMLQ